MPIIYSMTNKYLYSVNGLAIVKMAELFVRIKIGERVPTITELSRMFSLPRGTAQNALLSLQKLEAIKLNIRGHLGSYLIKKNLKLSLEICGFKSITGAVSLPYSKSNYNIAYNIYSLLEKENDITTNLVYVKNADIIMPLLKKERFDFALITKSLFDNIKKDNDNIDILISFKAKEQNKYVIAFNDKNKKEISDGMKIGFDYSSLQHCFIAQNIKKDKKIVYVSANYPTILEYLEKGIVDAAILNAADAIGNYYEIESSFNDEIVLVSKTSNDVISYVLKEIINY